MVTDLKRKHLGDEDRYEFLDEARKPTDKIVQEMKEEAKHYGFELTDEAAGSLKLRETERAQTAYAWLAQYFQLVGDSTPNGNELHVDKPRSFEDIHNEYTEAMKAAGVTPLALSTLHEIRRDCFKHVKFRKYKACSAKCRTCSDLTELRLRVKSPKARDEITRLHYWHRYTFMSERRKYYERRLFCETQSEVYLSTISDGMQQAHNDVPWHGASGNQLCPKTLGTKLQGVLVHGTPTAASKKYPNRKSRMSIYRCFANIDGKDGRGQNIALHAWLSELEYEYKKRGRLPPVLFHQFDGGTENANKMTIAVAEWLVLKGLTTKVVLTRLPVGHTHEDIDAQFAHIWAALRLEYVLSPTLQKALAIKGLLGKNQKQIKWHDIFCVPDYSAFFEDYCDNISRAFKRNIHGNDWTQLQWIVEIKHPERQDSSEDGPADSGIVQTTYRAYASDEVVELWHKDRWEDGKLPDRYKSTYTNLVPVSVSLKYFSGYDIIVR
jgi:hypothetical protein